MRTFIAERGYVVRGFVIIANVHELPCRKQGASRTRTKLQQPTSFGRKKVGEEGFSVPL